MFGGASVCSLHGHNITQMLSENLSGDNQMPDLLFMNVDTFSKLLLDHKPTLLSWKKRDIIDRIVIDEIHTLYGELFRSVNSALCRVSTIGCQIVTMSGTIPSSFVRPLTKHLRISTVGNDVLSIVGGSFIGDFPTGFRIEFSEMEDLAGASVAKIHEIISQDLESTCVHVIVSSKKIGLQIAQGCADLFITYKCISSDDSQETVLMTAKEWSSSSFEVLVSTTVALVGNENSKCGSVIIVGYLFDLMSVVQAVSRLRVYQRKSNGRISFILPTRTEEWFALHSKRDATRKKVLENRGLLDNSCIEYDNVCTIAGIRDWVKTDVGCRIRCLSARFGYASSDCLVCDRCLVSPITAVRVEALQKEAEENSNLNTAMGIFRMLEMSCIVCHSDRCNGENCLGKGLCYRCGSQKHLSSACDFKVNNVLQRRGCFFCFDLYVRQGYVNHDKNGCPLQRRLKRLLIHGYGRSGMLSFHDYLCKNLADENALYTFLATHARSKSM
jgi:hypothetical protein